MLYTKNTNEGNDEAKSLETNIYNANDRRSTNNRFTVYLNAGPVSWPSLCMSITWNSDSCQRSAGVRGYLVLKAFGRHVERHRTHTHSLGGARELCSHMLQYRDTDSFEELTIRIVFRFGLLPIV